MGDAIGYFFVNLVDRCGIPVAVSVVATTIAIAIGLYRIMSETSRWLWARYVHRSRPLDRHHFFTEIDYYADIRLERINTQCPIRRAIYIDVMRERFHSLRDVMLSFVSQDGIEEWDDRELLLHVQTAVEEAYRRAYTRSLANGVPEFVLDAMLARTDLLKAIMHDAIKGYCRNTFICSTNRERISLILEYLIVNCKSNMNLLEGILDEFNGDIKRLKYKGRKCAGCAVCVHERHLARLARQ